MAENKCPVCGWAIENAVEVATADGAVEVCCPDCAEKLQAGERSAQARTRS